MKCKHKSGIYNELVSERTFSGNQHGSFLRPISDYFTRKFNYTHIGFETAPKMPSAGNLSKGIRHDVLMTNANGDYVAIECILHVSPTTGEAAMQLARSEETNVSELILVCPLQWTNGLQSFCEREQIPLYTFVSRGGRRTLRQVIEGLE